jgi:hypothetical protein
VRESIKKVGRDERTELTNTNKSPSDRKEEMADNLLSTLVY